jgi:hypothetical protein
MVTPNRTGRNVGGLLLLHLALGLITPFVLLHPIVRSDWLTTAANGAGQVRAAVFIFFLGSALPIAIAIVAFDRFRRCSPAAALWLLALGIAGFSLQTVDSGRALSMVSLSQQYASAGAARRELFESLALVASNARLWSHYTALFVTVVWILLFCAFLFRFRLVPRWLSALGVLGSVLQLSGVSIRGLLGYSPEMRMAMPLAPIYVAIALWLIVKGFDEKRHPSEDATRIASAHS